MCAAGLIDIKRRIKSVESTRKITNAMGLVATSKLRKCRKELLLNNKFVESTEKIVKKLASSISDEEQSIYFNGNNSKDKLYIVMTSDTGLCGGFNANIVSYLETLVKKDDGDTNVVVVGKRGIGYVKKTGIDPINEYVDISDLPTVTEAKIIFEKALEMYINGEVSEVNIVYSEFISPVKQQQKSTRILPIEKLDKVSSNCIIEPNVEQVLGDCLNIYLKAKVRSILLSSKCSEQSSRMTAMDGATQNANDLLSNLNLKFNRIRQQIITQEISEIVGGAEAQK
ncbi:ATP synthase F1 subunit gamma [Clostridium weizhouense]|uniref:ATP synthase gamma chain n=1 Tax=Clostridium weizhouense TaxID=2859781 RepID=A0ABS7AJT4_9CLOT|nr:ATP synthase F1 subunit gamma [Clostridium weizhouense]MBW6408892.1 F0F1 ATP synthase subunit gamma [Clostridium weizhouense]